MDKESEIVASKIESGEYFREALSWFHSKFTGPRTEFSYVLILCVLSLITLLIGFLSFSEIFPLAPGANFYMSRPVEAGEHIKIHAIKGEKAKPNTALLNFLLSEYVRAHEEYYYDRSDANRSFIKSFSDAELLTQFDDAHSTSNAQSPYLLYGLQANIDIRVTHVRLLDAKGAEAIEGNAARAVVDYKLSTIYINENTEETVDYQAEISFQYKQITVDQKSGAITQKPDLVVTGFTTKKKQNQK